MSFISAHPATYDSIMLDISFLEGHLKMVEEHLARAAKLPRKVDDSPGIWWNARAHRRYLVQTLFYKHEKAWELLCREHPGAKHGTPDMGDVL